MINRLRDWKVQIAQLFLPLLIIPVVQKIGAKRFLDWGDVPASSLKTGIMYIVNLGDWAVSIALVLCCYHFIRKANTNKILKQNLSVIVWHSYFGYWVCRYALNYQTVSLVRVPIPVQFKLVWNDLFEKYECGGAEENVVESEEISVQRYNDSTITDEVNFVLVDTYPLDWRKSLPPSLVNLTTVVVDRPRRNGTRCYSKAFIGEINKAVHDLDSNVDTVNAFATVNPAHVYHLVKDVFKTGARDKIKRIRVYQQTKDTWTFDGDCVEIKIGR